MYIYTYIDTCLPAYIHTYNHVCLSNTYLKIDMYVCMYGHVCNMFMYDPCYTNQMRLLKRNLLKDCITLVVLSSYVNENVLH